ncbi:DUF7576 family protein [Halosimplex carlsbadense]|uniref:DUF7576 family protein n=1 Tax=Halosimplex carlsbadense TaxID=171164 RepID=UPI001378BFA5|nr:hypothetical protein [Halosimplex carlsbadense]
MGSQADENGFESCAHCGARLSRSEWYPARSHVEDGSFAVASFCDEACLRGWREG